MLFKTSSCYYHHAWVTTLVICFSLLQSSTLAQDSLNLTFSLIPKDSTAASSCESASDESLTLTTFSIPAGSCFNIPELFGANATADVGTYYEGTTWSILGSSAYDPARNYSRLYYKQLGAPGEEQGAGRNAPRNLQVFPERDCTIGRNNVTLLTETWYGWSCQSSPQGDCYDLPYSPQSFAFYRRPTNQGQCWIKAQQGAAVSLHPQGATMALMSAVAAVLLLSCC